VEFFVAGLAPLLGCLLV